MALFGAHEVKAALVAKLKANATIFALFGNEIKEVQYQGTEFSYPACRVRITTPFQPLAGEECSNTKFGASIFVFSESDNSLEADEKAGIIYKELHGKQFVSNNIVMSLRMSLVPAIRSDIRTWRSEIICNGIASKNG